MAGEQIGIKIGLQGVQAVQAGLQQVQAGLGGLATQAGSAGAALARLAPQLAAVFSVGAFAGFARGTADAIGQMKDLSDATGASIEEISKLDAVARRTGGTFDTVAGALVKFNQTLNAAKPGSAQAEALQAIGLEAAKLRQLDPAAALRETAVALSRFADDGAKARLVQELFGKSVREVAPLLNDLAEAGEVAASVTSDQADQVDRLNKDLAALRANITNVGRAIALELAPLVATIAEAFQDGSDSSQKLSTDLSAVRVPLEALTILASDVGFVFKGVGREIGAIAAQLAALGRGDLAGFRAISEAVKRDAEEARKALDAFQARVLTRGPAAPAAAASGGQPPARPTVKLPPEIDPKSAAEAARAAEAAARAAKQAAEAYARFTGELDKSIRLQEEELANGGPLSAARRIQIEGYQRLAEVAASLTLQQRLQIRGQIEAQAAGAAELDQQREQARIVAKLADDRAKYLEQLGRNVDASRSAADAAADELVGLIAGKGALEELRSARLDDAAAELERKAINTADEQIAERYREEARALRDLAAIRRRTATATADNEVKAANDKAAEDAAAAWQRTADQIGASLTDAIIQGGLSGREALERTFKTLVLRPFVDAAVQPIAGAITSSIGGLLRGGGGGGGLLGSLGAASGAAGFAGSFGTFGSLFNAGAALTGTGISGTLGALSGAGSLIGQGQVLNGLGLGAGALGPYAAAALVIASVAKSLDKSGTPSTGSVVTVDSQGARTGGSDPSSILSNFNKQTDDALRTLAGGAVGLLNGLAQSVGQAADFAAQAKFTADNTDSSFGDFVLSRGSRTVGDIAGDQPDGARSFDRDPTKGFESLAVDVAAITRRALDDIDLPAFARKQIKALGDDATLDQLTEVGQAIQTTISAIGALRTSLQPLAGALSQLAGVSSDSLFRLAELSGGFDQLGANISAFYENFTSESDRAAAETERITSALGKFGLALPATRDEFADLVQAQIALGDAGQPALAALLGVAGAFDTLADRAEALQSQLDGAISNAAGTFLQGEELRQFRVSEIQVDLANAGVQIDLQTLLGASVADIRAFAQAFISSGDASAEAQIAVLNAAVALAGLRQALDDTAAAADEAAAAQAEAAAQALADRRAAVTGRLDSVAADFLSPAELQGFQARRIVEILAGGGVETTVAQVLGATTDVIRDLFTSVGLDGQEAILEALPLWQSLNDSITATSRSIAAFRGGSLADSIENARLATLSPQDRIARLRSTETQLFGELATTDDPVGVAQRLQTTIIARIREESDLRKDVNRETLQGLEQQLDSARALRDTARELPQFTNELRLGSNSPLGTEQRLSIAESLFQTTLVRARGGDRTALSNLQGNAQAFIEAGIQAFGSSPQAGAIFDRVTNALDALAADVGGTIDPQISALEQQVASLESLDETAGEQLTALLSIDAALAARQAQPPGASDARPGGSLQVGQTVPTGPAVGAADGGAAAAQESMLALLAEIKQGLADLKAATQQAVTVAQGHAEIDREGHVRTLAKLTQSVEAEEQILSQLRFGTLAVAQP